MKTVWVVGLLSVAAMAGVLIAVWLLWQSRMETQRMRAARRAGRPDDLGWKRLLWIGALLSWSLSGHAATRGQADDALPFLGRFDRDALQATYPVNDRNSAAEMARLLYQMDKISPETWGKLQAESGTGSSPVEPASSGDVATYEGVLQSIQVYAVPGELVEYLEYEQFALLLIEDHGGRQADIVGSEQPSESSQLTALFVNLWPSGLKVGDRLWGKAVVISASPSKGLHSRVLVTSDLHWIPASFSSVGWQLLSEVGFDLGTIDLIRAANRKPLQRADAQPFYSMLSASRRVAVDGRVPKRVPVTDLLSKSESLIGDWMRLEVDLIRITKVAVDRSEVVSMPSYNVDHYYQLDAIGDLGNVEVQIKSEDPDAEPLAFGSRFPLSIVTTNLPEFLSGEAAVVDEQTVSQKLQMPVVVDGFFYRLWAYESDLSTRQGRRRDQFGPLVVATDVRSMANTEIDAVGVRRIGWMATGVIILGTIAIVVWNQFNRRADRRSRRDSRQAPDLPESW